MVMPLETFRREGEEHREGKEQHRRDYRRPYEADGSGQGRRCKPDEGADAISPETSGIVRVQE